MYPIHSIDFLAFYIVAYGIDLAHGSYKQLTCTVMNVFGFSIMYKNDK